MKHLVLPGEVPLVLKFVGEHLFKLLLLSLQYLQGLEFKVHGLVVEFSSSPPIEAGSGGVLGNSQESKDTYVDVLDENVPVFQRIAPLHQRLPQILIPDFLVRDGVPQTLDRVDLVDHLPIEILPWLAPIRLP